MTDGAMTSDAVNDAPPLAALLAELAAGLPEARATSSAGQTEWTRGGVPFASLVGDAMEVRLDRAVAAAALKTPDASHATRGLPWVRFAPRALDGHAIDRATAWFELAYRRAVAT